MQLMNINYYTLSWLESVLCPSVEETDNCTYRYNKISLYQFKGINIFKITSWNKKRRKGTQRPGAVTPPCAVHALPLYPPIEYDP